MPIEATCRLLLSVDWTHSEGRARLWILSQVARRLGWSYLPSSSWESPNRAVVLLASSREAAEVFMLAVMDEGRWVQSGPTRRRHPNVVDYLERGSVVPMALHRIRTRFQ